MKISTPGQARANMLDRNPLVINANFSGSGLGPHGSTQRWTYTVPAGRKALVELLHISVRRGAAAAPVGKVWGFVLFNALSVSIEALLDTNAVGDKDKADSASPILMTAAQVIAASTQDLSTAGNVDYQTSMVATEFDA